MTKLSFKLNWLWESLPMKYLTVHTYVCLTYEIRVSAQAEECAGECVKYLHKFS